MSTGQPTAGPLVAGPPVATEPVPDEDSDGYRGPATVTVDGVEHAVELHVLGHTEPFDGRYRWYGRVGTHAGLDAALGGRKATARVTTPVGEAEGELSDVDPWGRYSISGTSTPPYPVGLA